MQSQLGFHYRYDLEQFVGLVWGNPKAILRELRQGVEFMDLGGSFDAFQQLFAGILPDRKILVRNEYHAAMHELQSARYSKGAYVIGQPGIGKSLFLIYALVERLGQKRAVALQFPTGKPFYALFRDGTVTFHPLGDVEPLSSCTPIWALCDSNQDVQRPDSIFLGSNNIRVIQTTSPKASRWKEWSRRVRARPYVMEIWSKEEVVDLAALLDLNAEHMISLAKKWGGIPRTLLEYAGTMDSGPQELESLSQEADDEYHTLAPRAVQGCQLMFEGGAQLNIPDDPPSSFYFIRPRRFPTGTIMRHNHFLCVPTPTLCNLLAAALQEQSNAVKLAFYQCLSAGAETCSAAGYIYEYWFHSFVCAESEMQCQWVTMQGRGNNITQPFHTLRGTNVLLSTTLSDLSSHHPPYYWVAPKNFPGIDSILVLETGIIAFQVTISSTHRSPNVGLQRVQEKLPSDVKKLPWSMLFVGPDEEVIKLVAEQWAGKVVAMKMCIPTGWSSVDTSRRGIIYKLCPPPDDEGNVAVPVDA